LASVAAAQTQPEADAQLAANVRQLVRQLDDPSLAQREAAERSLTELGAAALPLLPNVTPRMSAEVKDRLARVRSELEKAAVAAVSQGTRVTLKGEMTLGEALVQIEKQTGNKAVASSGEDAKLKLDIEGSPYWQALDEVLDQAGMSVNIFGGRFNALTVISRPDGEEARAGRAAYEGLFRFDAVRVESRRSLRNPNISGMQVALEIAWEPRITPISIELPLDQLQAASAAGDMLAIDARRRSLEAPGAAEMSAVELNVPLELPGRDVEKIASLKGQLIAMLPGRQETFEFTDLANANRIEQRRGGVTVTLETVRKNNDLHVVYMYVAFDEAANALESHRGWIYQNEAYLLDPKGERVSFAAFEATRQADNGVGKAYLFDLEERPLAGFKFVYKTPAAVVRLPVDFELKDIPLP
jgi:hypothetical protein